jgi:hypothetical protein
MFPDGAQELDVVVALPKRAQVDAPRGVHAAEIAAPAVPHQQRAAHVQHHQVRRRRVRDVAGVPLGLAVRRAHLPVRPRPGVLRLDDEVPLPVQVYKVAGRLSRPPIGGADGKFELVPRPARPRQLHAERVAQLDDERLRVGALRGRNVLPLLRELAECRALWMHDGDAWNRGDYG